MLFFSQAVQLARHTADVVFLPGCAFTPYLGYQGQGATQASGVTGVDACLQACVASATCRGCDVTSAGACWLHTRNFAFNQLQQDANTDHYELPQASANCRSGKWAFQVTSDKSYIL